MLTESRGDGITAHELTLTGQLKGRPIGLRVEFFNPFRPAGQWLKGNLHCHLRGVDPGWTDWSGQASAVFKHLGYHFIAGMDHDCLVEVEAGDGLLIVPGAELAPGHLLALGVTDWPAAIPGEDVFSTVREQVRAIAAAGGIAVLAHPMNSNWSLQEMITLAKTGLQGFEVCNTASRFKGGTDRADQIWHLLTAQGVYLSPLGSDDAHGLEDIANRLATFRRGWTGVQVDGFSVEQVLSALRAGRCYASEGPELHGVRLEPDGRLEVKCSPVAACHFRSGGGNCGGMSVFAPAGSPTSDRFIFDFTEHGYRFKDSLTIVLEDELGRCAWAGPIRLHVETTAI